MADNRTVEITIPADYLADMRTAAVRDVDSASGSLRLAGDEDRDSAALIARRSMTLLDKLLDATGRTTVAAEDDITSSPIIHALEEFVEMVSERLGVAVGYGPTPMGEVLALTEQLRWAASEAIRISPGMADRLTAKDYGQAAKEMTR